MKRILVLLLILMLVILLLPASAHAQVSASSCLVMEQSSGRVLYAKNPDSRLPMASTTKIMTALVALEEGGKETKVTVSPSAAGVEGSSMYLETGEILTAEELLYGLMLSSGNDAAVALAEQFGGMDTFVAKMNQKAEALGAANTRFKNPNGLPDEEHYSTARDMATITAAALKNPDFARIVATKTYQISGEGKAYPRTLTNHNKLLQMYEGCIGVKTGFTKAAGRCLVSAAEREGMTLICVTLNAPDDWNDHIHLYRQLFAQYQMSAPLSAGTQLGTIPVQGADQSLLPFGCEASFSYPLKEGETLSLSLSPKDSLSAPVDTGEACGTASVSLGETQLATLPLVTMASAPRVWIPRQVKEDFFLNLGTLYRRWLTLFFSRP